MKNSLNKIYTLVGLSALLFAGCQKPNYVEPSTKAAINDFYASLDGHGTSRLFGSRFSNDTIYVDVNYHYPLSSDNEVDLSKLLLKASLTKDSHISPSLNGFTDLTTPKRIKLVAGDGSEKEYVVVANKQGDATVHTAKITYLNSFNQTSVSEAIINGNKLLFFITPGDDVSNAKIEYTLNKHASGSFATGSNVNLANSTGKLTVTAPGDKKVDYVLEARIPVKLDAGVGISKRLFSKTASELSFATHMNTGIAVSGDYLLLCVRTNPSTIRVINRFTGAYVKTINASTALGTMAFQIVADTDGAFVLATYNALGGRFKVVRYDDVNDTSPDVLIDYVHAAANFPVSTGDRAVGRKVRIYGDLKNNAVLVSSIAATSHFYRWTIANGALVSNMPEVVTQSGLATSLGTQNSVQPTGVTATSNYFSSAQGAELKYMKGGTNVVLNAIDVEGAGYVSAINYFEFNNAKFLATTQLKPNLNNNANLVVYDVTNPANFMLTSSSAGFDDFRIYKSETFVGTDNTNATSDICFGKSADGETMQVYMLLTNGGILAHEFTKYSDKE